MTRPLQAGTLCLLIAGLVQGVAATPALENARASRVSPTGGEATAFRTAPRKGQGSGTTLDYLVEAGATADAVRITLRVEGITDPAGASLRLVAEEGLALPSDAASIRTLPAGQPSTLTLEATRQGAATPYLNVFVTQRGMTDVVSIRASVEAPTTQAPAPSGLKQTPAGEKFVPLPVK
jgi:hypothetical protein